jgi:hypothetical protein
LFHFGTKRNNYYCEIDEKPWLIFKEKIFNKKPHCKIFSLELILGAYNVISKRKGLRFNEKSNYETNNKML